MTAVTENDRKRLEESIVGVAKGQTAFSDREGKLIEGMSPGAFAG